MNAPETGNAYLSICSSVCAFLSIASIQPMLTFVASIVAIVSGTYSIIKATKKK
jgi:uncharacterized BrkB/YihY/UPF0761 family membrane protein